MARDCRGYRLCLANQTRANMKVNDTFFVEDAPSGLKVYVKPRDPDEEYRILHVEMKPGPSQCDVCELYFDKDGKFAGVGARNQDGVLIDGLETFMFYPVKDHNGEQCYVIFDDKQLLNSPKLLTDPAVRQEWMDRLSLEQQRAMKIGYEKIIADKQASKNQP